MHLLPLFLPSTPEKNTITRTDLQPKSCKMYLLPEQISMEINLLSINVSETGITSKRSSTNTRKRFV